MAYYGCSTACVNFLQQTVCHMRFIICHVDRFRCFYKCCTTTNTMYFYAGYLHFLLANDASHHNIMCNGSPAANLHLRKRIELLHAPKIILKNNKGCIKNLHRRIFMKYLETKKVLLENESYISVFLNLILLAYHLTTAPGILPPPLLCTLLTYTCSDTIITI